MKQYVKSSECRLKTILSYFSSTVEEIIPKHNWCDVCRDNCFCGPDNVSCKHELPDIVNIMNTTEEFDLSDTCSSDESYDSRGSDIESVPRKPQVIYSESD